MFLSLSKTMVKFGGVRLGVGMRMSKKNAPYLAIFAGIMLIFKFMWSMMIVCFWLMYALGYGIIIASKKLIPYLKKLFAKLKNRTKKEGCQGE